MINSTSSVSLDKKTNKKKNEKDTPMWVFASLCSHKHFYRNTRGFINLYLGCVIITTKKNSSAIYTIPTVSWN